MHGGMWLIGMMWRGDLTNCT